MACLGKRLAGLILLLSLSAAQADVYLDLERPVATLAQLLQLQSRNGGRRLIVVNGQRIQAELSRSSATPETLLQRLAARYPPPPITEDEDADLAQWLRWTVDIRRAHWGAFGRLALTATDAEPSFLVLALPGGQGVTDVWTLRFGADFDLLKLLQAAPNGDVAGEDPLGIERAVGTKRLFSLAEYSEFGRNQVAAYEGSGIAADYLAHYQQVLQRAGATVTLIAEPADGKAGLLYAEQEGTQISISVEPSAPTVLILVQTRTTRGNEQR